MDADPFDDPEDPTDVDGQPPARLTPPPEITKSHNAGDWLLGFNRGVPAGRVDVLAALRYVLGYGAAARDIEARVLERLNEPAVVASR